MDEKEYILPDFSGIVNPVIGDSIVKHLEKASVTKKKELEILVYEETEWRIYFLEYRSTLYQMK